MILIIAVLAILLLIVSVAYRIKHVECEDLKRSRANDFMQFNFTKEQLFASQKEVDRLKAGSLKTDPSEQPDVETGTLVKRRYCRPVTAETYRNLFDLDVIGLRVLEHLTSMFCKSNYVRGGQEAERESCFRAGQTSVIEHIIKQINRANDPNYKEETQSNEWVDQFNKRTNPNNYQP